MKKLLLTLLIIPTLIFATNPEPNEIKWLSFEKAIELNKQNPKPILVDIYTDWCHWCKVMDKKTYANTSIAAYINQNFYAVKFNAEQKEDITYNGVTFKYTGHGRRGSHELAAAMLKGKLSFPSTVFLNKDRNIVDAVPGYIKAPMMEKIVKYMGEEIYLKQDFKTFETTFKSNL